MHSGQEHHKSDGVSFLRPHVKGPGGLTCPFLGSYLCSFKRLGLQFLHSYASLLLHVTGHVWGLSLRVDKYLACC